MRGAFVGANATPFAKLIIDFKGFVLILSPHAAIRTERVAVFTEATRATPKTPLCLLQDHFFGKPQVYLIE
jgi:hypothetical protein